MNVLNVGDRSKRNTFMRNIPSLFDIRSQHLEGILDILGYETIPQFKVYDLHYCDMIYKDQDMEGNLVNIHPCTKIN